MIRATNPSSRSFVVLAATLALVPMAAAQEGHRKGNRLPPEMIGTPSDVRDLAGLFSADAIKAARETLQKLEKATNVATMIETTETLKGENIDETAVRLARRSGLKGVFILIAKKEAKIEVLSSRAYAEALPRAARNRVRQLFIDEFRQRKFDDGLRQGVEALEKELRRAEMEGKLPKAEKASVFDDQFAQEVAKRILPGSAQDGPIPRTEPAGPNPSPSHSVGAGRGPLVVRNQVKLTLEGARTILRAAEERAAAMNLRMNIAVVDDGGHLLAFERMDGARPASGYTSLTKAITAATFRQPTGPIPAGTTNPDPILNLSLQNAALASGGKITTLYGGVPVTVDGQVIGGVGIGGGSGEQDAQVARAGIDALLEQLKAQDRPRAENHGDATKAEGSFDR
jgi:glc operon protein GlcG